MTKDERIDKATLIAKNNSTQECLYRTPKGKYFLLSNKRMIFKIDHHAAADFYSKASIANVLQNQLTTKPKEK